MVRQAHHPEQSRRVNPNNQIPNAALLSSTGYFRSELMSKADSERVEGSRSGPNPCQNKPEPPVLSRTECFGHWELRFGIYLRFGAWDL